MNLWFNSDIFLYFVETIKKLYTLKNVNVSCASHTLYSSKKNLAKQKRERQTHDPSQWPNTSTMQALKKKYNSMIVLIDVAFQSQNFTWSN